MNERFVYNERGFLLLEHILSLVIVGILSWAMIALLQVISVYHANQNALTQHEVNTLSVRLQNEVQFATSLSATENHLQVYFSQTGDVVSFVVRNGRLIRQVNGSGGEVLVYHLQGLDVTLFSDQAARLELVSIENQSFNVYVSTLRLDLDFGGVDDDHE